MSIFKVIRGTMGSLFGVGGPAGVNLKHNSGVLEARNAGDSAYAIVRGAAALADNDLINLLYLKTAALMAMVTAQFDGNNTLPSNSGSAHYILVTTTGANATIGQLLYDDGSGSGTVTVISALTGRIVTPTIAFSGGTVTMNANSLYEWTGTAWTDVGGTQVSGAKREIRMAITNAASQSSATQIPANAIITSFALDVQTPFSGGATISAGISGTATLFMDTTENVATLANEYIKDQNTSVGSSAAALLITVAGSPAAGAGYAILEYAVPNA